MSSVVEYDFASVGERLPSVREIFRADVVTEINYNLKTPIEFNTSGGGLFVMNSSLADCVRDNFKNLLLTNWGERVEQYSFGANLKPLVTELGTPQFDTEAIQRIRSAVKTYMPYIQLATFAVERLPELTTAGLAAVRLKITYSVPAGSITNDGVYITLFATG